MELWVQIVSIVVAALVPTGGVTTLFLVRGKRKELEIANLTQVIERWKDVAADRKNRADELKVELDKRDNKIDQLYKEIAVLRDKNDKMSSLVAVLRIFRCRKIKCDEREPPMDENIEFENE